MLPSSSRRAWPTSQAIFARWELHATVIGEVTDDGALRVRRRRRARRRAAGAALADDARATTLEPRAPGPPRSTSRARPGAGGRPGDAARCCALLGTPNVAQSKRWVYRQYDQLVGTDTVSARAATRRPAAQRARARDRHLARRQRPAHLRSTRAAAARARSRGRPQRRLHRRAPAAVTDCLNFGNPEKPEVVTQLAEAIEGMAEACRALGMPVVSGNVWLYNENAGAADPPDPGGRRGRRARRRRAPRRRRRSAATATSCCWGRRPRRGSAARTTWRSTARRAGRSRARPRRRGAPARALPRRPSEGLLARAHDVADGGLAVAVAEWRCSAARRHARPRAGRRELFGEGDGRAVVICGQARRATCAELAALARRACRCARLGAGRRRRGSRVGRRAGDSSARRGAARPTRERCRGAWSDPRGAASSASSTRPATRRRRPLTFFGLYALQHRGQESAGIAVADGRQRDRDEGHGPGQPGLRRAATWRA